MNIGCACEGFKFSQIINAQVPGPVDGMHGYDFKSTLDIFNGKLFDALLNDKIEHKEINQCFQTWDEDEYLRYYIPRPDAEWNWNTIHNNFELPHRKEALKKRINNFYEFNKNLDDDSYYFYTVSDGDSKLSEDTFNYVISNLPENVINRLIVIGTLRFKVPELFYYRFKCIEYNADITFTNERTSKITHEWMLEC